MKRIKTQLIIVTLITIAIVIAVSTMTHSNKKSDNQIPIKVTQQDNELIVTMEMVCLDDDSPVGLMTINTEGNISLYNTVAEYGLATITIPINDVSKHVTFIAIAEDHRGQMDFDVNMLQVKS